MHIKINKGLDIPIEGKPLGLVKTLNKNFTKEFIALDLKPFDDIKFKLLCQEGEEVKIGQPLAEDKSLPGRMFVSPAGGTIKEIRRGLKRRLLSIIIEKSDREEEVVHSPLDIEKSSPDKILESLMQGGLFSRIRQRPFARLAHPQAKPRCIFVKAIESAPFVPSAEMQVEGHEEDFQAGLNALAKLTSGPVHLVYRKNSPCRAFTESKNVERHTAEGPHPIGTHSVHIHFISPIKHADDVVWTVTVHDVICIGHLLTKGKTLTTKIIGVGGPILQENRGFFHVREGIEVKQILSPLDPTLRFISGDVLTGEKVEIDDFLGFYHFALSVIPENSEREFLHFFRLGPDKFTASKTYLSGHFHSSERLFDFTTSQHGEKRAFVTSTPYEQVMPMRIPTMLLVKAILAEDYELSEELGLLEIDSEDFALATFVCPSKIEMSEIVKNGLRKWATVS